jgi:hypothetical protein
VVVHEVRDSSSDFFLANASAASQLFAWRTQLVEAAAIRVLKRLNSGSGSSGGDDGGDTEGNDAKEAEAEADGGGGGGGKTTRAWLAFSQVMDLVCRECRHHFDVDPNDASAALDKLCVEGVLERRQQVRRGFN